MNYDAAPSSASPHPHTPDPSAQAEALAQPEASQEAWAELGRVTQLRQLTDQQVERSRAAYDLEFYATAHPFGKEDLEAMGLDPDHPDTDLVRSVERERTEMAEIIGGMRPGIDVLFVEGIEHSGIPPVSRYLRYVLDIQSTGSNRSSSLGGGMMAMMSGYVLKQMATEKARELLDADARDGVIGLFTYAQELAMLSGVEVVYMDPSAEQLEKYKTVTGGRDMGTLFYSGNEADWELALSLQPYRDREAVNVELDWMVERLPAASPDPEHKRRLVALRGYAHQERIEQLFATTGFPVEAVRLDSASDSERVLQHRIAPLAKRISSSVGYRPTRRRPGMARPPAPGLTIPKGLVPQRSPLGSKRLTKGPGGQSSTPADAKEEQSDA